MSAPDAAFVKANAERSMTLKGMQGSDSGLIEALSLHLPGGTGKTTKNLNSVLAEIGTRVPPEYKSTV
jgi:hypothetical protein